MSRDELIDQFGKEIGEAIPLTHTVDAAPSDKRRITDDFKRAEVFHVWDEINRQTLFVATGFGKPIDIQDDELGLRDFYPIPEPLFYNQTGNRIEPVPMYVYYQDQANELNEITKRITRLTKELKRRGVYDASIPKLKDLIESKDNTFKGVEDFSALQQKGGIDALIAEMDISRIAQVVAGLYQQRAEIIGIIHQLIGLGDIQRAKTDPRETFGAQKLKSRYGSLRPSEMQKEVQRFVRDILSIQAEIIGNRFSSQSIAIMANVEPRTEVIPDPINPQAPKEITIAPVDYVESVIKPIIDDQEPAQINIDIDTDSTIAVDEEQEKADMAEFTNVMAQFAQASPILGEAYGEDVMIGMLVEVMKRYKLSRRIQEQMLDRIEEIRNAPPEQPQPSEAQIKAQMEQQKLALEAEKFQVEAQLKAEELRLKSIDMGVKSNLNERKFQFEVAQAITETGITQEKLELEKVNPNKNVSAGV